jgi:hypothetical protein
MAALGRNKRILADPIGAMVIHYLSKEWRR